MCGRHLADTRCGMMILPLLSYVTEQLTARTGTRNRYGHCLSNLCKLDSFFLLVFNFFFTTFKFPFFHFTLLDWNPSPFNFPQSDCNCKTRGHSSFASSRASALKQSCMPSLPTYSALHLLSGVLESSKALSGGDVRSSPVPGGVPAKTTGQCTLVFS